MSSIRSTETANDLVAGQGRKSLAGNDRLYRGVLVTGVGTGSTVGVFLRNGAAGVNLGTDEVINAILPILIDKYTMR